MSVILLQEVLTRRLKLKRPQFVLRKDGPYINGSIVSESFNGKGDLERQLAIWAAMEAEFGEKATKAVGIDYTPAEWDLHPIPASRRRRSVRIAT